MKKYCLFLMVMFLLFLMVISLSALSTLLSIPTALAQGAEEGEVLSDDATEGQTYGFADYFRAEWLDKLMQYACVLLGAVTAVVATLRRVKSAHAMLQKDADALATAQNKIALAQQQLADTKQTYYDTVRAVQNTVDTCRALYDETAAMRREMAESITAMRRAMRIAYCANPDLVNSGCAQQIGRILEVTHEEDA